MRCQCCRNQPATIRVYDVTDWRTQSLKMICDNCAKLVVPQFLMQGDELPTADQAIKRAQSMLEIEEDISELIDEESGSGSMSADPLSELLSDEPGPCPTCGWSFDDLKSRGRLGCPECYNTFREPLDQILERIHATVDVQHVGRSPGELGPDAFMLKRERIANLKREMDLAVKTEDYERAAQLRDQVTALEAELERERQSSAADADGGDA